MDENKGKDAGIGPCVLKKCSTERARDEALTVVAKLLHYKIAKNGRTKRSHDHIFIFCRRMHFCMNNNNNVCRFKGNFGKRQRTNERTNDRCIW